MTFVKCPPSLTIDVLNNFESMDLYNLVWCIQPWSHIGQIFSEEEYINLPKVHLRLICTTPVKCPPRKEKEGPEDEIGLDGITLLEFIHWVSSTSNLMKIKLSSC